MVMSRLLSVLLVFSLLPVYAAEREIQGKHLRIGLNQSLESLGPGAKVTLIAQVKLAPGMHVYAPSIEPPYRPIRLALEPAHGVKISAVHYPEAKKLHLDAIDETVPVYEGSFTLTAEAVVAPGAKAGDVVINGRLNYQTCDDRICYLPVTIPVTWTVKITPASAAHSGQ